MRFVYFCGAQYSRFLLYACSGSVFLGRFNGSKRNSHMVAESCDVKNVKHRTYFRPQGLQHIFFHRFPHGSDDGLDAQPLDFCRKRQSYDWQFGQFRISWYSNPRIALGEENWDLSLKTIDWKPNIYTCLRWIPIKTLFYNIPTRKPLSFTF